MQFLIARGVCWPNATDVLRAMSARDPRHCKGTVCRRTTSANIMVIANTTSDGLGDFAMPLCVAEKGLET